MEWVQLLLSDFIIGVNFFILVNIAHMSGIKLFETKGDFPPTKTRISIFSGAQFCIQQMCECHSIVDDCALICLLFWRIVSMEVWICRISENLALLFKGKEVCILWESRPSAWHCTVWCWCLCWLVLWS